MCEQERLEQGKRKRKRTARRTRGTGKRARDEEEEDDDDDSFERGHTRNTRARFESKNQSDHRSIIHIDRDFF